jgi:tubulin alpha
LLVFNAIGGGTSSSSALSSLPLSVSLDYGKKSKLGFTVYASLQVCTSVVEPYNSVLFTHSLLEHTDVAVLLDNRLLSLVISSLTASLRFDGVLNVDANGFQTNLMPYQGSTSCLPSYALVI